MSRLAKVVGVCFILVVGILYWNVITHAERIPERYLSVPQLLNDIKSGKIKRLVLYSSGIITGTYVDGSARIRSMVPRNYVKHFDAFEQNSVDFMVRDDSFAWRTFVGGAITMLIMIGLPGVVSRLAPK
jgi:hypothetical protein